MRELALDLSLLPPSGGTVACALSGGADSVCLLHRLLALAPALGLRVCAAHFNHRLRGADADADEAFVRGLCEAWGVPLAVDGGDTLAFARENGLGMEEAARTLRYRFLTRAAGELGADAVATAHSADDNAETVLFNLVRGSGLRGLLGIPPRRGLFIRPMLGVTRAQVEAYCAAHALAHVEDATNADQRYARNRLRHRVMPVLRELNPRAAEHIAAACARLRADDDALEALARGPVDAARQAGGGWRVEAAALASLPRPAVLRALRRLIRLAGGRDLSAPHLEAAAALLASPNPSARLCLPGVEVRREYGGLLLLPRTGEAEAPPPLGELRPGRGETLIGDTGWTLRLAEEPWPGLAVRARRPGDRLTLPGRPAKSLKKLLIEEKVPRPLRDRLPVLADGEGVVAAAGLGPNTAHPRFHPDGAAFFTKGAPDPGIEKGTAQRPAAVVRHRDRERMSEMLEQDFEEILFTPETLARRVEELGAQITRDYAGREPVVVSVLRGSYIFMADLTRAIHLPITVDFMAVSSYGKGSVSSGQVQILKDLAGPLEGRDLLLVEDILDSGNTLSYLMQVLQARGPTSIRLCTLLDKPERRVKPVTADYCGFTVPDAFVAGYGLDYGEKYRNLPFIGVLKREIYGG